MPTKKNKKVERPSATRRKRIRLAAIQFDTDRFCHSDTEALKAENLETLIDSLIPTAPFRDVQGHHVLVKGHRKVKLLANMDVPGSTPGMSAEQIKVTNLPTQEQRKGVVADNDV